MRITARRRGGVAEENELGVAIRRAALLRQNRRPSRLCVVQHEADELRLLVLCRRLLHRPRLRRRRRLLPVRAQQSEEVLVEEEAEDEQEDRPSATEGRAADPESAEPARSAPVFNVAA